MKNYVLVYLVDNDPTDELKDTGNDPDFSSPPTWGICRPDIRNENTIDRGSVLLFVARKKEDNQDKYFIKGYFVVVEKINIIQAHNLFGERQNVIISTEKRRNVNNKWENKKWQNLFDKSKVKEIPEFLKNVTHMGVNYYQKDSDDHGLDNWKCRRIYNCYLQSFAGCIKKEYCQKEQPKKKKKEIVEDRDVRLKKNYIVGDFNDYKDWNPLRIEWKELATLIGKPTEIKLKNGNKHPEIEITDHEFEIIKNYMNIKEAEQNSSEDLVKDVK